MVGFARLIVLLAFAVAVLVVLAVVIFGQSAVYQVGVGTIESVTNPHIAQDTMQEYALVQENFSQVQTAISGAVANVTGGNLSQVKTEISGAVANVTGGNFSQVQSAISGAVANVTGGNLSQVKTEISGAVANVTGGR
jgi:hypothetical protein